MKFIYCIILLVLLAINSTVGQTSVIKKSKLPATLKSYYSLINKAELAILEGNYLATVRLYDSAFSYNKQPHAKDIYNCFISNILIKEYNTALKMYQKLTALNFDIASIKNDTLFSYFLKRKEKEIEKINLTTKIRINKSLLNKLKNLFKQDQYYRLLSKGDYSKYEKEIQSTDSINSLLLLKYIKKYGFPNEYDIGINNNPIFVQDFYYIIWHQLKKSSQTVDFTETLYSALYSGKIEPHIAAFLIDLNCGEQIYWNDGIVGFTLVQENIDSCCYIGDIDKENATQKAKRIQRDKKRTEIGLETLEMNTQKIIFRNYNNHFLFPQYDFNGNVIYHMADKESFNNIQFDKLIKVEKSINNKLFK